MSGFVKMAYQFVFRGGLGLWKLVPGGRETMRGGDGRRTGGKNFTLTPQPVTFLSSQHKVVPAKHGRDLRSQMWRLMVEVLLCWKKQ